MAKKYQSGGSTSKGPKSTGRAAEKREQSSMSTYSKSKPKMKMGGSKRKTC